MTTTFTHAQIGQTPIFFSSQGAQPLPHSAQAGTYVPQQTANFPNHMQHAQPAHNPQHLQQHQQQQQPMVYYTTASAAPHALQVPLPTATPMAHHASYSVVPKGLVDHLSGSSSALLSLQPQHSSNVATTSAANTMFYQNSSTQATSAENMTPPTLAKLVQTQLQPQTLQQYQPSPQVVYVQYAQPYKITNAEDFSYNSPATYQQQYPQQQVAWPPVLSWRQRKLQLGRSDRLRCLANELSRKDHETQPMWLGFGSDKTGLGVPGPNEKDNTSASETSKSQHTDKQQYLVVPHKPNRRQAKHSKQSQSKKRQQHQQQEQQAEDDDNLNQTVSELLSMLSGSGESHQAFSKDPAIVAISDKQGQHDMFSQAIIAEKLGDAPAAPDGFYDDMLQQDRAIKEIKTTARMATAKEPVAFFDTYNIVKSQAKPIAAKKAEKVLLAEDEATDQMIYFDKSTCMHAPKANQVPIF